MFQAQTFNAPRQVPKVEFHAGHHPCVQARLLRLDFAIVFDSDFALELSAQGLHGAIYALRTDERTVAQVVYS
jgi:hypothetical protein